MRIANTATAVIAGAIRGGTHLEVAEDDQDGAGPDQHSDHRLSPMDLRLLDRQGEGAAHLQRLQGAVDAIAVDCLV